MAYYVTRKMKFDAAHRVLQHESKCKHLHGHEYRVELTCTAIEGEDEIDALGRVIDFGVIKQIVGTWIDDELDHNTILNTKDPLIKMGAVEAVGRPPFLMPEGENPTAENLAKLIYKKTAELLKPHCIRPSRVLVWETTNCNAVYEE